MRSVPLWIGLAVSLSVSGPAAAQPDQGQQRAGQEGSAGGVHARFDDGLLTLEADGAPLAEVLRAIGEAGAFRVVLRGALATPVYDSYADRPLDKAMRRLVGDHALVMTRGEADAADGPRPLIEIRVVEHSPPASPGTHVATEATNALAEGKSERTTSPPSSETPDLRWHPILALDGTPTKDDILSGLRDQNEAIRMAAVPLVGWFGPSEAVQVLAHAFAQEEDMLVRSRGVAALTRLQAPGAATLLRQRASRDQDPELRMQALNALAASAERGIGLADRRITPVMGQALRADSEPQVRLTAIRALQRVGGAAARAYLQQATTDLHPDIAAAAQRALAAWREGSD